MTEEIGKFVQFDHEPDEREIEHEQRALAARRGSQGIPASAAGGKDVET